MAMLVLASPSAGQSLVSPAQPIVGLSLDLRFLRDLPTSNAPLSILETLQVESIADGFTTGGLNPATALKVGAYLNSWTQTQVQVGDVLIADPRIGGIPLLVPTLSTWERVTSVVGGMGVDDRASGLSITLEPRRPGATWVREIEGSFTGSPFVGGESGTIPVVDRPTGLGEGSASISGPVTERLGLFAAGSWRQLSHVAATSPDTTTDTAGSAFAHLVFAATPRDEVRTIAWVQRLSTAAHTDTVLHLQSTWARPDRTHSAWRVFGGYTGRQRTVPVPSVLVVDSLNTDPVSDLMETGEGAARRWTVGARLTPRAGRYLPALGVDLDGASVSIPPVGITEIQELVDGQPSRLWTISGAGTDARGVTSLALHANEHLTLDRLSLEAGVRFETIAASADGAARGISWSNWLPRASARLDIDEIFGLSFVAAYRRSAYQVPLNVLAVGSPAAPVADVARWDGTSAGPLIARVGPGTGGDGTFTQLDPDLERPLTDELVFSAESRPIDGLLLYLRYVTKHEHPLPAFTETAIPASEYTAVEVPDPLYDPILSPFGGPTVTAFNRPPGSYGRDRYLLTNRADDQEARFQSTEFGVRVERERFDLIFSGIYLSLAHGPAAAVGFRPTQNDQHVLGNLFVDPNNAQYQRGQLFPDRSHTGKAAAVFRLPWRTRLGVVARYQDGQPFARVITVPDLTQGPTAVRVAHNGSQAFTFTGTLDVRFQKMLTAGRTEVTLVLDVYNLPGLDEEVAEYIGTSPDFRTPTALQPARTAVIGARVEF